MSINLCQHDAAQSTVDRRTQRPMSISFWLQHDFSMLAFSSAIEPLRIANQLAGRTLFEWETRSITGEPVSCSNGIVNSVDGIISQTQKHSMIFICGGTEPQSHIIKGVAALLWQHWRRGNIVGSLCTGAFTLADAGLLNNRRFTLHWEAIPSFREVFPLLDPEDCLYCNDRGILTCSGGSAATDMMIRLISENHSRHLADDVVNMCLHQTARPGSMAQRSATAATFHQRHTKLALIVDYFREHLESEINMDLVSDEFDLSKRQIERLFKKHTGMTPMTYLRDLRLERGRGLLAATNMNVIDVAIACGFNSTTNFSNRFRKKFGVTPAKYTL